MVGVFLAYLTAAGCKIHTELPIDDEKSIFFLPDNVLNEEVTLTSEADDQHSHLCLGMCLLLTGRPWVRANKLCRSPPQFCTPTHSQ